MTLDIFPIDPKTQQPHPVPLDRISVDDGADEDAIINELHFHHPTFDVRFAGIGVPCGGFDVVLGRDNMPIYALRVVRFPAESSEGT